LISIIVCSSSQTEERQIEIATNRWSQWLAWDIKF